MTIYYEHIRVLIDPEQSEPLAGGGREQDVSLILTGHPHALYETSPAGITLDVEDVRCLALDLLALADEANEMRGTR